MHEGADREDLEPRIRRLEALEAIRQLVARHALAIDSRDLNALVGLYVEDVAAPRPAGAADDDAHALAEQLSGAAHELAATDQARRTAPEC